MAGSSGHGARTVSWVAAGIMIAGTIIIGAGVILASWPVFIAGLVVGAIGLVLAFATNIMGDYTT